MISTIGEEVEAFIPEPLPPSTPLAIDGALQETLDQALLALGRLDSVSTLLPDTSLFLYMYIKKEAVLSSQIEGTQSSLSDLLLFEQKEMPGVPLDDVEEASHYVRAMRLGLAKLKEGMPVCSRLMRDVHGELLASGRGRKKNPGEFRRSQNWIGGTRPGNARFVPPPPENVPECMSDLEKFINDDPGRTPTIVKAALAHAQFQTIHPFLDGNGRLGRLLVTLLFCAEGVLREPLLYLSLYLKAHRDTYYELLQEVRVGGDWEAWVSFFAEGVLETAKSAVETARDLVAMFASDREKIENSRIVRNSALRIHHVLQSQPMITIRRAAEAASLSVPSATAAVEALEQLGILEETTGKQRNRIYGYKQYVGILNEGTSIEA